VEAQNQVVRKLEEKERLLQTNLATVEKVQFINLIFFLSYAVFRICDI
jgi:hypothetical protein